MYLLLLSWAKVELLWPLGYVCNYAALEHWYVKLFQPTIKSFYEKSGLCI